MPAQQLPIGLDNPSSETERQVEEDACAQARAGETQNSLDRAEEEPFSSESEGHSVYSSTLGAGPDEPDDLESGLLSNGLEDDDDLSSEEDGDLPAKAEFALQNLTTAEEWKIAEAHPPGNKSANPPTASRALP